MKYQVTMLPLPATLVVSDVLTEDERPKVYVKPIQVKPKKKVEGGPAFHAKSAKNSKVNSKVSRKDVMGKKYGKPIKRSGKK
jgi:ATP-dependent RNA helicase RhlE